MADIEKVKQGLRCCQYASKSQCDDCKYCYDGLVGILDCTADLASDALSVIEELQAEIERLQPRWIPIEDSEKPKTLQMVWVAYRMHNGKICTRLAKYRDYGKTHWLYPWDGVFWEDVIAWMPLKEPEPPREG